MDAPEARKVKRKAVKLYRWLWLSPLLTVITAVIIYFQAYDLIFDLLCSDGWRNCQWGLVDRSALAIAILGSALWHLFLLIPALDNDSEFVRWHGRQSLLLAGVRTAVPLGLGLLFGESGLLFAILLLIIIWLAGTLWGQGQAKRGDCSLARWLGHADVLPPPEPADKPAAVEALDPRSAALLEAIRYSPDKAQRDLALRDLRASLPPDSDLVVLAFKSRETSAQGSELRSRIAASLETIRANPDKRQREEALKFLEARGLVDNL